MQGDKTLAAKESESDVRQLGHGAGRELLTKHVGHSHPKYIRQLDGSRSLGKQKVSLRGARLCLDLMVTIRPLLSVQEGPGPGSPQSQRRLTAQLGEIRSFPKTSSILIKKMSGSSYLRNLSAFNHLFFTILPPWIISNKNLCPAIEFHVVPACSHSLAARWL